jgi:hypothetical protein
MGLPGFTAEAGLYLSGRHYVNGPLATRQEGVVPQGFFCEAACFAGFLACEVTCLGLVLLVAPIPPPLGEILAALVLASCTAGCVLSEGVCSARCKGIPPPIPAPPLPDPTVIPFLK